MKFQYFLFDWDGCLADTTGVWVEAYFKALEKRGLKISFKELREKAWGNHEQGPKNLGISDFTECWNEVVLSSNAGLRKANLQKGTKIVLRTLKKHSKMVALVTSSYKDVILSAISYHKINNYFDSILTKEDVKKVKPDPEMILSAIKKLGAKKEEVIIVGDTESDILAGKAAGIKTALILHPESKKYNDFDKLLSFKPDFVFERFSEIDKLL